MYDKSWKDMNKRPQSRAVKILVGILIALAILLLGYAVMETGRIYTETAYERAGIELIK